MDEESGGISGMRTEQENHELETIVGIRVQM